MRAVRELAIFLLLLAGALPSSSSRWAAQTADAPAGFRVAGILVSKTDGHALIGARVALASVTARRQPQSVTTTDDGRFEFSQLPAGKYSLSGAQRGFIPASYDQHDQYSTAIVTGADLDTEHLVLKLDPQSVVSGRVLDENGEPVRDASVTLYRDSHLEGVHRIQSSRGERTNDLGEFDMANLTPGTYFVSVSAQPWYATHPPSGPLPPTEDFDRSLDVAYPLTYYGDATDPDSATPIALHGGEKMQAEIHLNPVPSLHLIVHVPDPGNHQYPFPMFEQPAFDGSAPVQRFENRMLKPGIWEISGIPAGKYDVRFTGPLATAEMSGVDLDGSTRELDASTAQPMCSLKASVSFEDDNPRGSYFVVLRGKSARITSGRPLDKGQARFENLAPGSYEVLVYGPDRRFSVGRMQADGATVTGHTVSLSAGASASLSISAVRGSAEIQGRVRRSGQGFAGAMVVLVPQDPENHRDRFRRDQSDLDGTFAFHAVIPGSYTAVAIENGWDLDWGQPELIARYAKRGLAVRVGDTPGQTLTLDAPLEAQMK